MKSQGTISAKRAVTYLAKQICWIKVAIMAARIQLQSSGHDIAHKSSNFWGGVGRKLGLLNRDMRPEGFNRHVWHCWIRTDTHKFDL